MPFDAIGDLLPAAVAVALSPFPIVAIVLILGGSGARSNGVGFAIGWMIGLAAVAGLVVLVAGAAGDAGLDRRAGAAWLKLVLGALFLVLAAKQWTTRPPPESEPELPGWMATLNTITPGRSVGLGAALSGANPKTVVLTVAASASIVQAGLDPIDTAIAVAAYVVIGSITVIGSVLFYLVDAERAAAPLGAIRQVMIGHGPIIMTIVLLLLGAKLIGDAIAGLLG